MHFTDGKEQVQFLSSQEKRAQKRTLRKYQHKLIRTYKAPNFLKLILIKYRFMIASKWIFFNTINKKVNQTELPFSRE